MFQVYKDLGWFFKQEWKKYLIMLFLLLTVSFIAVIPASLIGYTIDAIKQRSITRDELLMLVGFLFSIGVLRYIIDWFYHYLINYEGQKLSYQLRQRYLEKLFVMDSTIFEEYTKGEILSRVTNDLQSITVAATQLLQEIVYNGSLLIFTMVAMTTTISLKLTIASVTIMPIAVLILMRIINHMRRYYSKHRIIYANMTEQVLESIEGVKVVRANVQEEKDYERLHHAISEDINSWRHIVKFESLFGPAFDFIYSLCYFIAFAYGSYLVIHQEISVGNLVSFSTYLAMLYGPIINLSNIFHQVNNAIISSERFKAILDQTPKVYNLPNAKPLSHFDSIVYDNVTFTYPNDSHATIENISFTLKNGETIGIVGPTGSGKSTLIRQLLRQFPLEEGQILIDGIPIEEYRIEDIRNIIGLVPQSHILFRDSVKANIQLGNPEASDELLKQSIVFADFMKDLAYLSDGLETLVGELGTTLSGGQKQRLSIARAVVREPEILILDDSLSALDAKTEETIIRNIKEQRKGKTNIIVAHRFSAIKEADQIIVLVDGKIQDIGTHDELMARGGWYREQYIKQTTMEKMVS